LTTIILQYPYSRFSCSISLKMDCFLFTRLTCINLPEKCTFLYIKHMSHLTYHVLSGTNLPSSNLIFTETTGIQIHNCHYLFRSKIKKSHIIPEKIRKKSYLHRIVTYHGQ
jgi:hypothetical protein